MFVDNAGADVVLGMLPLVRELLRRGCRVTMAANDAPSINDITRAELAPLVARVDDPILITALFTGTLKIASNGSDLPVIDLGAIDAALAEDARDADLIVLQGMGRAIETNLHARFVTCDALRIGMIKHAEVAACLGGSLFDCVCRFARGEDAGDAGERMA